MSGNRAVFLDRDGVINKDRGYISRIDEFEYLNGAVNGLKILNNMGFMLIVVTNQSGIARGYYTEEDYLKLDEWMKLDLISKGVIITASYYCPHLSQGEVKKYAIECNCRKPKTEMFWKAAREYRIDMDRSFAIGDNERDLCICNESGVKGILLSQIINSPNYETAGSWEDVIRIIRTCEH